MPPRGTPGIHAACRHSPRAKCSGCWRWRANSVRDAMTGFALHATVPLAELALSAVGVEPTTTERTQNPAARRGAPARPWRPIAAACSMCTNCQPASSRRPGARRNRALAPSAAAMPGRCGSSNRAHKRCRSVLIAISALWQWARASICPVAQPPPHTTQTAGRPHVARAATRIDLARDCGSLPPMPGPCGAVG